MKKLDLGNSDFKSFMENDNYFVDKSLLISEVIDCQHQVILLPRPRRFGKTLNLSMLQCYFDINQAEETNLFTNLNIWQEGSDIKDQYAKYPVISISFKDIKGTNWKVCSEQIKEEIADLYEEYSFLLESDKLTIKDKTDFSEILNGKGSPVKFQKSLKRLSKYLYNHYNKKVIILIDEYDTPIQASHNKFYEDAVSFIRGILSGAMKDNKFLYKGVITGILKVSKESIFSGLNNVGVFTVLDNEFSDKFGFNEQETKNILKDFDIQTNYEQVKKWYNGYKFGATTDIYNPWSILNYASKYKNGFKPFWINTSSEDLLRERLKERDADYTREQLLKLINNGTIEKTIDENFVFPDLETDKELLWSLFTFSGYLTVEQKTGINSYTLKIPNYEIKFNFKNIILKWLDNDVKIRKTLLEETTKHLTNNEIEKFEKGFKQIIGDTFSYFDTKSEPENVYQSYVLGLLAIIGDDYIIKSNRESGDGRYDILLIPHDKTKYGIVIEIKQVSRDKNESDDSFTKKINSKITEAKNQIELNQYYLELIDCKIEKIIKLPIVFAGKVPYITLANKVI